jgi:predicted transcriptional regulator
MRDNPKKKHTFRMSNSQMVMSTLQNRSNLKACAIAEDCGLYGSALNGTLGILEARGDIRSSTISSGEKIYWIAKDHE